MLETIATWTMAGKADVLLLVAFDQVAEEFGKARERVIFIATHRVDHLVEERSHAPIVPLRADDADLRMLSVALTRMRWSARRHHSGTFKDAGEMQHFEIASSIVRQTTSSRLGAHFVFAHTDSPLLLHQ